jgi:hypothetical protein
MKEQINEIKAGMSEAALKLDDELLDIDSALENARFLIGDITCEYFCKYNNEEEKDRFYICYDFERYRICANMLFDYIIKAEDKIKELRKIGGTEQ